MTATFDNQYPSAGRISEMAAEFTLDSGGGTFRADTFRLVLRAHGFAVGLHAGTAVKVKVTGDRRYDIVAVARAIRAVRDTFPAAPFVGAWLDGGTVHVDPVVIIDHRDRRAVLTVARALGQRAYLDFATGEAVTL